MQSVSAVRRLLTFRSDRRASVSVELALALPMLIALLMGGVEITNYVLIHQKVERTSATIADLVAQSARMTENQMQSLFSATEYVMKPDLASDGNVVVSSITGSGGKAIISWQRSSGGGDNDSRFGVPGSDATEALKAVGLKVIDSKNNIIVLRDGENIIAGEVFYNYRPMLFSKVIKETTLYRYSFFRPRFGKLEVIHP